MNSWYKLCETLDQIQWLAVIVDTDNMDLTVNIDNVPSPCPKCIQCSSEGYWNIPAAINSTGLRQTYRFSYFNT